VKAFELPPKDFSKDAEKSLAEYGWPGNVRELENTIKRASILSRDSVIERRDLFNGDYNSCSVKEFLEEKLNGFLTEMKKLDKSNLYDTVISEVEKALFSIVLKETEGNQVGAARILGIKRNTLSKKIRDYKII
jgi:two-component system nitrogen regulation response regulator GlnG